MRVFVTGATGWIGSAVVRELLDAGHEVVGLARSDDGAAAVKATGAEVLRGSLEDLDSLRSGAEASDGVIHTAFIQDFANWAHSLEVDRRVINTIGEVLAGSDRPLIITSGPLARGHGRPATEEDAPDPELERGLSEELALSFVERGVRVSVMRIPPMAHGKGDHQFVPQLIRIARDKGVSAYPGDGANRWAAVHVLDAAHLFRLALESAPAGVRLHAVAEEGVRFSEIAEAIGRHLNLPVTSVPAEEVEAHFGLLGQFVTQDVWVSSALTRRRFDWQPVRPKLIPDLEEGHYFTD